MPVGLAWSWRHPDVGLGELVEHVGAFLDILILASGYKSDGSHAFWDADSLHRALEWAFYFEQVLQKLPAGKDGEASKLALDLAVDALLAAAPLPPGMPGGLSFTRLANARSYLVETLVQALPVRNAWLAAKVLESDDGGSGDLWEVFIKAMSERCVATGIVKSLQQALDVATERDQTWPLRANEVDIWKSSTSSLGSSSLSSFRTWAKNGLQYVTSAETIHKLSGATLIFSGCQEEWVQTLDSLLLCSHREGSNAIRADIAELCCLFLASTRWKELPNRLLYPSCKSFRNGLSRYRDCWGRNDLDGSYTGSMSPQTRIDVENYLQTLVDLGSGWWNLAPILVAVALIDSPAALDTYIKLIEKRRVSAALAACSSDSSCQHCLHRCDAQERAWCLLILLDEDGGSELAIQLQDMLETDEFSGL